MNLFVMLFFLRPGFIYVETGGSLHTRGSISTAEHKARMEFDTGKRVGLPDMYRSLHFKLNGEPVDENSRRLQEEFENSLTQRRSQIGDPDSSNPVDEYELEHEVWMDVSGGMNKKGRILGVGNLARAYKDFSSSSSSRSITGCSYVRDQAVVKTPDRHPMQPLLWDSRHCFVGVTTSCMTIL